MVYFVYFLQCEDGSIYTGITTNLERRLYEHQNGKGGHYTSGHRGLKIMYNEMHPDKISALRREAQLKGWTRAKKLALIEKH